ncbi:adenylate/guanylate cyclase domain-containing protein [Candidatus Halobeggiatoa sp. HSG11]|nr:adenylate/guanylate cyclase domain-containing protein [Candidatus Halobeggiatoa sp. HSG11]
MHKSLLQLLLSEKKIGFLITDNKFLITEYGGEYSVFVDELNLSELATDAIPELCGCEDILQDVLTGILPQFKLENLNRTLPNDDLLYLDLTILSHEQSQLLIIITNTTVVATTQQALTQQRNELSLTRHTLIETNQRIEYILQYYVPREVGKALMEDRLVPKLGGEEREITTLFADLRNYTSTSEKLTPNQTINMLHIYLDIATTAIAEAGGVVVNFIGDAVMAIFNAPNEQSDHAYRAAQAGLTIQTMAALYQEERDDDIPVLHFGVGINTGKAIIGNIGAQWHYQYTAIGDTVNVASRICSHARPDEVLIGTDTFKHVEDKVTAQPLPPIKFKGKSQEVTVYQIIALKNDSLVETMKKGL